MGIRHVSFIKVLLALAMLGTGVFWIILSQDEAYVATEASLVEASSYSYTHRSQEREMKKTKYRFQYAYRFQGQTYLSDRYGHVSKNKKLGVSRFQSKPAGTSFTVYVNPSLPWYAVVETGQIFLFIYVMALAGLGGLLHTLFEWQLDRLLAAPAPQDEARIESLRPYFRVTGAVTGIGILLTGLLAFFGL